MPQGKVVKKASSGSKITHGKHTPIKKKIVKAVAHAAKVCLFFFTNSHSNRITKVATITKVDLTLRQHTERAKQHFKQDRSLRSSTANE